MKIKPEDWASFPLQNKTLKERPNRRGITGQELKTMATTLPHSISLKKMNLNPISFSNERATLCKFSWDRCSYGSGWLIEMTTAMKRSIEMHFHASNKV